MRNTLIVNERRGRNTAADTAAFLHSLNRLGVAENRTPDEAMVLPLARTHRRAAYDAKGLRRNN